MRLDGEAFVEAAVEPSGSVAEFDWRGGHWSVRVPAGADLSITFQAQIDPAGAGCRILSNEALVGSEGKQLLSKATVVVGDCQKIFVPLVLR